MDAAEGQYEQELRERKGAFQRRVEAEEKQMEEGWKKDWEQRRTELEADGRARALKEAEEEERALKETHQERLEELKEELERQLREFTAEEEERVNKLRLEVGEEKRRQLEELSREGAEKRRLLQDLGAHETHALAAIAQHEADNKAKLEELRADYEKRERELEAQEARALEAKKQHMQDKVKRELEEAERQLREANEAATMALRRKREQLQEDMHRLEKEQQVRLAAMQDEHRRQLDEGRPHAAAAAPQEPVGLRVTMDEAYEEVEGAEGAFAAGLKADMAAAVQASDSRLEWCGMQRGSVRALLNVLPDSTGRDARSASALAESLVRQGADATSVLRARGVTKTIRLIEITAPGTRKHTSLQDWRALLPPPAKSLLPSSSEAAQALARREAELDELESEYRRRRHNLSLMEQRLKDEEARTGTKSSSRQRPGVESEPADRDAGDADKGAASSWPHTARRRAASSRRPPEEVSKVLKEMKDDIQRRLAAVLASREAYKTERRALDRQRDSPDYSFRLAFLRQVKEAINQQAMSLNADAARVKSVEKIIKVSQSRNMAVDVAGADWWGVGSDFNGRGIAGGGVLPAGWGGDVSDDNGSHTDASSLVIPL